MTMHPWQAARPLTADGDQEALAACMKALDSPLRLRVLRVLAREGPLRRKRLAEAVGGDPWNSVQILENAGLIERVWRPGERIEWRLVDGAIERVAEMLRS